MSGLLDNDSRALQCRADFFCISKYGLHYPDISGFLKGSGRAFEIEVKRPGGKPTPWQFARIEAVKRGGGISGVVTSVDEARRIIEGP